MHTYWASIFMLPASITKELELRMKCFLWSHEIEVRGKSKVAWKEVCLPKSEGGLGIKRISKVNKSLMAFHTYSILTSRRSLWVEWIQIYRLKNRSFWEVTCHQNATWTWRKLLQSRPLLRQFLWTKVGNGEKTFLWHDTWCEECPLSRYVSPRNIAREGMTMCSKVSDVCQQGGWDWPDAWRDLFPVLFQLQPLRVVSNRSDAVIWRNSNGNTKQYSAKIVWVLFGVEEIFIRGPM
ncbi:uncharacterized mitochondrial protein AtMg00310-like [Helianthus annuus]|uniref:uncharacterized mitochondrial protein AtMg00310-like n=1 Tax=Helianthus annuus TaxID=4232 RepID=UPI000B8F4C67|nr:uncharacterized mitochondrial protein AtMg00310-like [Helianthus annuus]